MLLESYFEHLTKSRQLGKDLSQKFDEHDLHHDSILRQLVPPHEKHHINSIAAYTIDSYPINYHLHQEPRPYNPDTDAHVDNLNDYINQHKPLPSPLSVFSGVSHEMIPKLKLGNIIHTKSFTSTSLNYHTAKNFAPYFKKIRRGNSSIPVRSSVNILHFKLPAGYHKGGYLEPHTINQGESEYLLGPDQHWKVTNHNLLKNNIKWSNGLDVTKNQSLYQHVWTVEPHHHYNEPIAT